ncbi:MAG TPA: class I SAM-dependent methyltransferase [Pyrinomonadaceae bacterium]|nr:class I SAM-dependent methyltransferase [Pyrinomonadaceae bacterium]
MAVNYDLGRDHGPEVLNLWMNVVSSHVKDQRIETILDLSCGTGRFTEALAVRFDAEVIGVDPSEKMLAQARHKQARSKQSRNKQASSKPARSRIRYEPGRGESIPLPDQSVDLIFMSMIFHHFDNPALAARECRRVLRAGAIAFLRTGTRERISSYPYVEFFPGSRRILAEALSTNTFMQEVFEAAGFRLASQEVVTQEIAPSYAAYADKLAVGADSVLVSLSPSEFETGMSALREYAARSAGEAVFEPIDVFVFRNS